MAATPLLKPIEVRVPVRAIILGAFLTYFAAWGFAFFTSAGWSVFTAFTEAAGHTSALAPALHQVILAGGNPTPAPTLLLFAPLVAPFGVVAWSFTWLWRARNAPHDPFERYRPRESHWRTLPLHLLFLLLVFHGLAGFPLAVRLFGTDILIHAWPTLAAGTAIVALTSAALALIFRTPRPR